MVIMHESGTTFAQALKNKYVDQEVFDNQLILPKDKSISTQIAFVGFGKVSCVQKQLRQLRSIDLSNEGIRSGGDLLELGGCLNNVQTLNLANNFLSWQGVVDILPFLPNLKELIITKNHLDTEELSFDNLKSTANRLSCLSLGRIDLKWNDVIKVLSCIWTCVEQLDLWDNNLDSDSMKYNPTTETDNFVSNIKSLRLSCNQFADIDWIRQIGQLESLTELDLSRCQLEKIEINHETTINQLKNLKTLNISYNNISEWQSISNLYHLKSLQHLLCTDNPLFISDKFAKPLTIGRLGWLKSLNREEITASQRRDSEIFYLRNAFPDYQVFLSSGSNTNFNTIHPRYNQLVELYGIPEDLNKKQVIDKYLTVDLWYEDKRLTKKLPCDMRVSNLKMLCKRMFNLRPTAVITITCCDSEVESSGIEYELDKDGQTLHFFSVKSGQTLKIEVQ